MTSSAAALDRRSNIIALDKRLEHACKHVDDLTAKRNLEHISSATAKFLETAHSECETVYNQLYELALKIRRLDSDEDSLKWIGETLQPMEKTASDRRKTATSKYLTAAGIVEEALADRAAKLKVTPAAQRHGGEDGEDSEGSSTVKLAEKFKPKLVGSLKMHPPEWTTFKRQLKAYFDASNLKDKTIEVQRAAFELCLDSDLVELLRSMLAITDESPIFGQDESDNTSCIYAIDQELLRRNPIFVRLIDLVELKQERGEKHPLFVARIKNSAKELGTKPIPVARIAAALAVNKTESNELKKKLLETSLRVIREEAEAERLGVGLHGDDYLLNQIEDTSKLQDAISYQVSHDSHKANSAKPSKPHNGQQGQKGGQKNGGGGKKKGGGKNKGNKGKSNSSNSGNSSRPSFDEVISEF